MNRAYVSKLFWVGLLAAILFGILAVALSVYANSGLALVLLTVVFCVFIMKFARWAHAARNVDRHRDG